MKKILILLMAGVFICAFAAAGWCATEYNTFGDAWASLGMPDEYVTISPDGDGTWSATGSGISGTIDLGSGTPTGISISPGNFTVAGLSSGSFSVDLDIGRPGAFGGELAGALSFTSFENNGVPQVVTGFNAFTSNTLSAGTIDAEFIYNGGGEIGYGNGTGIPPVPELPPGAIQMMVLMFGGVAARFRKR